MSAWRSCNASEQLAAEINAAYPGRDRASDGTIGDAAHAADPTSDHNPNAAGVVRARDITANSIPAQAIADLLFSLGAKGDTRLTDGGYVILNRRITNADFSGWHDYTGADPHTSHIHVSFARTPAYYDSTANWGIDAAVKGSFSSGDSSSLPGGSSGRSGQVSGSKIPVAPDNSPTNGVGWGQFFGITTGAAVTATGVTPRPGTTLHRIRNLPVGPVSLVVKMAANMGIGANPRNITPRTVQAGIGVYANGYVQLVGDSSNGGVTLSKSVMDFGGVYYHRGGDLVVFVQGTSRNAYTLAWSALAVDKTPSHYRTLADDTWWNSEQNTYAAALYRIGDTAPGGDPTPISGPVGSYLTSPHSFDGQSKVGTQSMVGRDAPGCPFWDGPGTSVNPGNSAAQYQTAFLVTMPSMNDYPFYPYMTSRQLLPGSWADATSSYAPFNVVRTGPNKLRSLSIALSQSYVDNNLESFGQAAGSEPVNGVTQVRVLSPDKMLSAPAYQNPPPGSWYYGNLSSCMVGDVTSGVQVAVMPAPTGTSADESSWTRCTVSIADPTNLVAIQPALTLLSPYGYPLNYPPVGVIVLGCKTDAAMSELTILVPYYETLIPFDSFNDVGLESSSVQYQTPPREYFVGFPIKMPPQHLVAAADRGPIYRRKARA